MSPNTPAPATPRYHPATPDSRGEPYPMRRRAFSTASRGPPSMLVAMWEAIGAGYYRRYTSAARIRRVRRDSPANGAIEQSP